MRRKFRNTAIVICAVVVLLLSGLIILVTEPLLPTPKQPTPPVSPARLEAHVRTLSEQFFPRDFTHTSNLDRAAAYIREEFVHAKGAVSDQSYQVTGFEPGLLDPKCVPVPHESSVNTYRNVIATFGPNTKERIVVGAHYDACGELPAADDNASGADGLIELAYLLGRAQLPVRVDLVAFTLEEPPYFRTDNAGSAVHAKSLKKEGVPLRFMISLEMIGYFDDTPGSQKYPSPLMKLFYPSRRDFAVVVGSLDQALLVRRIKRLMREGTDLPIHSINAPGFIEGIDWSDHMYYWNEGYGAVMVGDTGNYGNSNYHRVADTPEKLDYKRMAKVVEGVYNAVSK